jgi:hypothetical protein
LPVRIRYKVRLAGTVTPSALNTETDVISLDDQPDDFLLEGYISLQNMAAGDSVVIRSYVAVDGTTRVKEDEMVFSGAQAVPVVRFPSHLLHYNAKPRITITQTAGTLRSFPYVFIVQVLEVI